MMEQTICSACRREAPASILKPVRSVLDAQVRDLCPACIENKAEALPALVRTVNRAGWSKLPAEIRRSVRVWDIGSYVPVRAWAERMSKQQLALPVKAEEPPLEPEDEILLRRIRKRRQEIAKQAAHTKEAGSTLKWWFNAAGCLCCRDGCNR